MIRLICSPDCKKYVIVHITFIHHFLTTKQVRVNVVMKVYRGLPHGFLNLPTQLPKARTAIAEAGVYLEWLYKEYEEKKASESKEIPTTPRFVSGTRLRLNSNPKI